jgi:hypothetical protein
MTKRHAKEQWECPARDCREGSHDRQHSLTPAQRERMPQRHRRIVEETPAGAFRCSACGCVYLHESHLDTVVGYLDGPVLGKGWHPAQHA